ncbi:MAG: PfkB family carbohydrate kinase [Pseudomonadota bacterium]
MATILAVGTATLDIINEVDDYPGEDAEVRALAQRRVRGGNAANTLEVLARLGHRGRWAGMLADEPDADTIRASLDALGIDHGGARVEAAGKVPTSYITLSRATGSRTIVHHRDLPEFGVDDFTALDLGDLDWLHFEGRHIEAAGAMLDHVRRHHPELPISVEAEKPRPGIEELAARADVALYGRAFATARGYESPETFLNAVAADGPLSFCAWGEDGGWLRTADGTPHHEPAVPPPTVVDTIGAGDVFNAGVIHGLVAGKNPMEALALANELAGTKCGRIGFEGLEEVGG